MRARDPGEQNPAWQRMPAPPCRAAVRSHVWCNRPLLPFRILGVSPWPAFRIAVLFPHCCDVFTLRCCFHIAVLFPHYCVFSTGMMLRTPVAADVLNERRRKMTGSWEPDAENVQITYSILSDAHW